MYNVIQKLLLLSCMHSPKNKKINQARLAKLDEDQDQP